LSAPRAGQAEAAASARQSTALLDMFVKEWWIWYFWGFIGDLSLV
jgi:hypothetical protein